MQAVRVQYTVREDFVATNEANIRAVMDELRAADQPGVRYSAYREGTTFTHLVVLDDPSLSGVVPGLAAFQHFRAGLKGGATSPPVQTPLDVVGSSFFATS